MPPIPTSEILLPLYIYPGPGRWDPLFAAIERNPTIQFKIIVNPSNGPGSAPWWPNADYVREIPKLNAYPNVTTLGYIGTTYGKKPIAEVFEDISKYSTWSGDAQHAGLGVDGIFFDETVNLYTKNDAEYLDCLTKSVKETEGILGNRLVIHNPGTAVDARFAEAGPDITTVAEVDYGQFQTAEYQDWLAKSPYGRDQSSYMIHGAPVDGLADFVSALRGRARYLFVTNLSEGCYQSFGDAWEVFVEAISEGSAERAG